MEKKLNGQMIYEYRISIKKFENFFAPDWARAGHIVQEEFNNMATYLNEQLGLCCSCGERPEPTKLHEVAGEMLCSTCLEPRPEEHQTELAAYDLATQYGFGIDNIAENTWRIRRGDGREPKLAKSEEELFRIVKNATTNMRRPLQKVATPEEHEAEEIRSEMRLQGK